MRLPRFAVLTILSVTQLFSGAAHATIYCRHLTDSLMVYREPRTGKISLSYREKVLNELSPKSGSVDVAAKYRETFLTSKGKEDVIASLDESEYFGKLATGLGLGANPILDNFAELGENLEAARQELARYGGGAPREDLKRRIFLYEKVQLLNVKLGESADGIYSELDFPEEICRSIVWPLGVNQLYRAQSVTASLQFLNSVTLEHGQAMEKTPEKFDLYAAARSLYYGGRTPKKEPLANGVFTGKCFAQSVRTYPYSTMNLVYSRNGRNSWIPLLGSKLLWDPAAWSANDNPKLEVAYYQSIPDDSLLDRWRSYRAYAARGSELTLEDVSPTSEWKGVPMTFGPRQNGRSQIVQVREISQASATDPTVYLAHMTMDGLDTYCYYDRKIAVPNK